MQERAVIEVSTPDVNPDRSAKVLSVTPAQALIDALSTAGSCVHPATWKAAAAWVEEVERRFTLAMPFVVEHERSERQRSDETWHRDWLAAVERGDKLEQQVHELETELDRLRSSRTASSDVGLGRGYYDAPPAAAHCAKCLRGFDAVWEAEEHAKSCNGGRQPDATTAALEREVERRAREEAETEIEGLREASDVEQARFWDAMEYVARAAGCSPGLQVRASNGTTADYCSYMRAALNIAAQIDVIRCHHNAPSLTKRHVAERQAQDSAKPAPKTHDRCGVPLETIERDSKVRERCPRCGVSWLVKPSARPQSPWVPDTEVAPKPSIEALMREVFLEGTALPGPRSTSLTAGVLDLLLALREHGRSGDDWVTIRLSEVLP